MCNRFMLIILSYFYFLIFVIKVHFYCHFLYFHSYKYSYVYEKDSFDFFYYLLQFCSSYFINGRLCQIVFDGCQLHCLLDFYCFKFRNFFFWNLSCYRFVYFLSCCLGQQRLNLDYFIFLSSEEEILGMNFFGLLPCWKEKVAGLVLKKQIFFLLSMELESFSLEHAACHPFSKMPFLTW